MKKAFLFLMSVLLITSFTACMSSNDAGGKTNHTHTAVGTWEINKTEHWQICECGEEINRSTHELDDFEICEICHSSVSDYGDGTYSVTVFNENGDATHSRNYDESGNITDEWISEYKTDSDGNSYEYKASYISSDGTKSITEYDEGGNILTSVYYDADGEKTYETVYSYSVDPDGNSYEAICTGYYYTEGILTVTEYNEYGDETVVTVSDLDGENKTVKRFEAEYNDEGKRLFLKEYKDDVLVYEITGYKTYETDEVYMRFPEKTVDYYSDGTKLVTVFNDEGNLGSEIYFDEAGNVDYELTYTYEFFEDGNYKSIKVHKDGKLITEKEYTYDEEFMTSYMSKETEYDESGTVISITNYDSDGMELE